MIKPLFSTFSTINSLLSNVHMFINGHPVSVPKDLTVLEATKLTKDITHATDIPTLCYTPRLQKLEADARKKDAYNSTGVHGGVCRVCLVAQEWKSYKDFNQRISPPPNETREFVKMVPACVTPVYEGQSVWTATPAVVENVRSVLKFLLSSHPLECPTCTANHNCEFQDLMERYDVKETDLPRAVRRGMLEKEEGIHDVDPLKDVKDWYDSEYVKSNNSIEFDINKCIKCTRCIRMCSAVQGMNVLSMLSRGKGEHIGLGVAKGQETYDTTQLDCISCGQCTYVCPVGALTLKNNVTDVYNHLQSLSAHPKKVMVAQTAPSVRVALSEEFGKEPGAYSAEKMVAALRKIGFKYVFDTDFTADLTIMEEGSELLQRIAKGGPFPMFTSCCPAWVNLVEKCYPEYIPNLSTARSPQGMMSSLIKHYWAEKMDLDPKDVVSVSFMPCTAKKDEIKRPQLEGETDYVLTTREMGQLMKLMGLKTLDTVEPSHYDKPLGLASGGGVIFGATGGVMEAALRTAYELALGKTLPKIDFEQVRGFEGVKKATIDFDGTPIKIAVVHTSGLARKFLEEMKKTGEQFHFIEVMACYGGCIGGGGEPKIPLSPEKLNKRMQSIYSLDQKSKIRKSHENPAIKELYDSYLGKPLGEKPHHLLHTHFQDRSKRWEKTPQKDHGKHKH